MKWSNEVPTEKGCYLWRMHEESGFYQLCYLTKKKDDVFKSYALSEQIMPGIDGESNTRWHDDISPSDAGGQWLQIYSGSCFDKKQSIEVTDPTQPQ